MATAARRFAGPAPDLPAATAALARSAASVGATLTADDIAIGRASAAAVKLDSMIEAMRRDGTLAEFNARYKSGRAAAAVEGKGFMGYGVAMARLKAALIPMLVNRQTADPVQSLFAGIFGATPPTADVNDQATAATKISAQTFDMRHIARRPLCTGSH